MIKNYVLPISIGIVLGLLFGALMTYNHFSIKIGEKAQTELNTEIDSIQKGADKSFIIVK